MPGITPSNPLTGISKGSVFNEDVTADTNIFDDALSPSNTPTTFRIYGCFDTGGVLAVQRTSGGVTVSEELNGGVALDADAGHMFDVLVEGGETVNIQYSVNATCKTLKVVEAPGMVS